MSGIPDSGYKSSPKLNPVHATTVRPKIEMQFVFSRLKKVGRYLKMYTSGFRFLKSYEQVKISVHDYSYVINMTEIVI